jgi:hypothetical protein
MTLARPLRAAPWIALFISLLAVGCARTEIIESPRTGYVADTGETKEPAVVWTSRTLTQDFDYLGLVKSSSWTYQGALDRLVEGGRELRADAVVDVHFERVGFLKTMQAFAIKYK